MALYGYPRKAAREINVPVASDPPSAKPQAPIIVHGPSGLKVAIPSALIVAVVTAVLSVLGSRAAPPPPDARIEAIASRAEQAREDTKRELSALHEELREMRTEISLIKIDIKQLARERRER